MGHNLLYDIIQLLNFQPHFQTLCRACVSLFFPIAKRILISYKASHTNSVQQQSTNLHPLVFYIYLASYCLVLSLCPLYPGRSMSQCDRCWRRGHGELSATTSAASQPNMYNNALLGHGLHAKHSGSLALAKSKRRVCQRQRLYNEQVVFAPSVSTSWGLISFYHARDNRGADLYSKG